MHVTTVRAAMAALGLIAVSACSPKRDTIITDSAAAAAAHNDSMSQMAMPADSMAPRRDSALRRDSNSALSLPTDRPRPPQ